MPTVVGVKLRYTQKPLWFDPGDTGLEPGDPVIVSTERGLEFGRVATGRQEVEESELPAALKPVERRATAEDLEKEERLEERERDAMSVYRELVVKHGLDMKPLGVEHIFDGGKTVFYFVAEERVDFRELVRELASRFRSRIDMRQVGVRDEARMVGGLGHCGEHLCCARFAGEFQPVSIRMAKEQDLPLNPTKISGLCGRLMCCLRYEYEAYKDFKGRAPKTGTLIETPVGEGKVVELNCPRETLTVQLSQGGRVSVPLAAVDCPGRGCACKVRTEELALIEPGSRLLLTSAAPQAEEAQREQAAGQQQPQQPRQSRRRRGGPKEAPKERPRKEQRSEASAQPPAEARPAGETKASPGRRRRRRRRPAGGESAGS